MVMPRLRCGDADTLMVPNIESGSDLCKSLAQFANCEVADTIATGALSGDHHHTCDPERVKFHPLARRWRATPCPEGTA